MNKIVFALAALSVLAAAGSADARERYRHEEPGWNPNAASFGTGRVVEGRNAATVAPTFSGVESYITQSIEQDARSSR
ncbi:conserved hypothetical protein [Ancylobacter novellus DSM 506]|uniref:Uncharacterized protein n=1 Tax=Ancylobacter novellus (strain ATCC 8093 / DSM 506 / JCM 20403 / CCM 1077 / IAM 12100 / NBRC 12443 / NCIMB 10456) TaxID=639283 RepID=D7AA33_ANCN5|nr:hypothetical protein [Ancylobacter novellus]ADH90820.1 conserved hypothetical protein [Ancylobacter novellus DSM 506]